MNDQAAILQRDQPGAPEAVKRPTDVDRSQTSRVGQMRLAHWHRTVAAVCKADGRLPQIELTEQMGEPAVGRAAAHRRDPAAENRGIDQRLAPQAIRQRGQAMGRLAYGVVGD